MPLPRWIMAMLSFSVIVMNLFYILATRSTVRALRRAFDDYRDGSAQVFAAMAKATQVRREEAAMIDETRIATVEKRLDDLLEHISAE